MVSKNHFVLETRTKNCGPKFFVLETRTKNWAKNFSFLKPGQKIRNITTLQTLGNRFQQVHRVLAWFAWMGMVFAVLVVGMAIQRYLSAQRNTIMLLASFGHPPARTLQFFVAMCGLGMVVMLCVALAITGLLHMLLHFWLPTWAQGLWPKAESSTFKAQG